MINKDLNKVKTCLEKHVLKSPGWLIPFQQCSQAMGRCFAVAVEGRMGSVRFERADGGDDAVAIRAGQDIPAGCDGFDPFCFVAQGDAGNPESVGLFLHAA